MELFLIGVNVLLLMLIWKLMVRKTILDHYRDKLFDMRDQLRVDFQKNGWELSSPTYKNLRDLVNGYLRFTENYSFTQFVFLENSVKQSKELQTELKGKLDRKFNVKDPAEAAFILAFRRSAVQTMMSYMILSSGPLLVLALVMLPFVAMHAVWRIIRRGLAVGVNALFGKVVEFNLTFKALVRLTIATVANMVLYADFVEEYSYRQTPDAGKLATC
ncbi:hypothetical protein D3C72_271410 [compost metagenome]